jgi:hypothetical protein
MERKRYLFVSYMIAKVGFTRTGDTCFEFSGEKKVTLREIREHIVELAGKSGMDTDSACPAIIGLQVLDEDIAKMLYEF